MPEMRRWRTPVAALGVTSLLLAGCGSGAASELAEIDEEAQGVGAMGDYSVGETFVAEEPITVSLLYRDHPNYPLQDDWLILEHLEEEHGVTLDPVVAPLSDFEDRRSVLIGSGEIPDYVPVMWPGDEIPYISGGALLPVSDYLEYMPNFTDKLERWDLQEEFDNLRQDDGRAYILPGMREDPFHNWSVAIRDDIWQDMGFGDPETWDEFQDQLEQIRAEHPEMIPWSDRWEMNATLNLAGPNFNTTGGWGLGNGLYYDAEADELVFTGATDEYREMLEYFAGLTQDGLLDSESLTQDDDSAVQKFASGQSAAVASNEEELETLRTAFEEIGEDDAEVRMIRVPAGPAGDNVASGGRFDVGMVIGAHTAEREDFIAMLQFLDWLYYSDEGLVFATWGVEGETYEIDDDGERQLAEDVDIKGFNSGAEEHLSIDHGFYNGVFTHNFGSDTEIFLSLMSEEIVELQDQMADKEELPLQPNIPFDELELEQAALWQNSLTDQVHQATAQFILGQRDLDDWDTYVAELEARNMNEYVELANEAYQRGQEMLDELDEAEGHGEGE
ncbi:extracellular solute-binding protein [Nesterenkonia sp. HG001]|uniref:ABC transporter substrate-binding protein n=1 Tax=Nesterenkonia sp. HG001 TaxID=2983207 RepID=UPI002AC5F8B6|nr:extracellular solute-binding protein [Nesterenkonia sp. HG001]MDZ5077025.1 extracellular solute-binding protein [Nesterenkonia sp. HG001]